MTNFEHRFTNPTAAEVTKALETAAEEANHRAKLGRLTVGKTTFQAAAKACVSEPKGVRRWVDAQVRARFVASRIPATLVGLAWWTDAVGTRHVLVAGRRVERDDHRVSHLFGPRDEDRPPAWLLYPERLFLRTRDTQRELVAVCDCGAAGPLAALAWMGPCCGPCHDRQEEGAAAGPLPFRNGGTLGRHHGPVTGVAFSADGKVLAAASVDPPRYLWEDLPDSQVLFLNVRTGEEIRTQQTWSEPMLTAGGNRVVVCHQALLNLYDAATGEKGGQRDLRGGEAVTSLTLSPDGKTLAVGRIGRTVQTYDVTKGLPGRVGRAFEAAACCLAFAPDSRTLAVGTFGTWVHCFALEGEQQRQLRFDGGQAVRALGFDGAGRRLAAGTGARPDLRGQRQPPQVPPLGQVQLWDLSATPPRHSAHQTHAGGVTAVAFSRDGKLLVSAGADRAVRFWDLAAGRAIAALEWHIATINALAFSPDGETLATGSDDGTVKLWPWKVLLES
jgi:hypothetical protein